MELIMLVLMETNPWLPASRPQPAQVPPREAYCPSMAKGGDEEPPICGTCMGAGGEWMELNGKKNKERKWVKCTACKGTGRK
ncbi:hypothetical protein [Nonomuraea insulae]|uniref:Uncharacterized protein n=1 Tax=Nonomuraea insulae TaxID=1616787 RepID=A0ABW1DAS1_9ACTN